MIQIPYPNLNADDLPRSLSEATTELQKASDWALVTYGFASGDISSVIAPLGTQNLRACIHYSPVGETGRSLIHEATHGTVVPYAPIDSYAIARLLNAWRAEPSFTCPRSRTPSTRRFSKSRRRRRRAFRRRGTHRSWCTRTPSCPWRPRSRSRLGHPSIMRAGGSGR